MSTVTSKLGLIKPELTDNGKQTILDIAESFQKIDDAFRDRVSEIPISGDHEKNKIIEFTSDLEVGDYIGAINLRSGRAAPTWRSMYAYVVGDEVVPSVNNGHYYRCVQTGYSAPNEPTWLVSNGAIVEDTKDKSSWQPSTLYRLYDIVVPSIDNDRFYVCTVSGTSGTSEPNWATTNGVATSDNGVVWMTYRIVKWEESGVSANFRPFGKIE